ncbi:MAG: hypothetical protein ACKVHR_19120 [Pirellulales bacterium]|jgi:hypothetical protein
MSRFLTPRGLLGLVSLFVLGIGLPNAAMAVPQDPFDPVADDLVRIYVDEMTNGDCDYLVVAVLEGALSSEKTKKGYVVNLFPPGNDGSEKTKKGHVVNLFPPGNDGNRSKNTCGTGSGDAKSGSVDHNSGRSNKGGIRDTGGTGSGDDRPGAVSYSSSRSNRPSTNTGGGDSAGNSDVVQCEHCGASCTERCRCKPTGLDLIFGHTDDRLLAMESDADSSCLAFEICYGMRLVTLTSMGENLKLTSVIAKGWRAESRGR